MGKITIQYQRHSKSKWLRNWGLILFPLLPIWAVVRDTGNAGWLEVDGQFYAMKSASAEQAIRLPDGEHTILYHRYRHGFVSNRKREYNDPLTYNVPYAKHRLVRTVLTFDPTTRLCLSARGGLFRRCHITTLDRESELNKENAEPPLPPLRKKLGCGGRLLIVLLVLVMLFAGVFKIANGTLPIKIPGFDGNRLGIEQRMSFGDWLDNLFRKQLHANGTPDIFDLPTTTTTTNAPTLPVKYVNLEGGLRLRTEPNPNCDILLVMPDRAMVQVEKTEGDWCYVIYDGQKGWCKEDYLVDELPITSAEAKRIAEELVAMYHDYNHFVGLVCSYSNEYVENSAAIRAKAGWNGDPMEMDILEITCCRTIQEATEHLHQRILFDAELSDHYVEYDGKLYFGFYDGKGGFTLDNVKVKSYDSDSIVATAVYSDPGGEELVTFQIQKKNGYWGIKDLEYAEMN